MPMPDPKRKLPRTPLSYAFAKRIFRFILKVFFRRIDALNQNVVPEDGPIILVGNHANQFVDGMNLVASSSRAISFLIAQKSYDRRYIGDVAKAIGAVPVLRPQDIAFKGTGRILRIEEDAENGTCKIIGDADCRFTEVDIKKGAKIRGKWEGDLLVSEPPTKNNELSIAPLREPKASVPKEGCEYKILPKIDQKQVFNKVFQVLAKNGTIGIFPEGGSHDQGHLIPLKAGVTIMALGAASQGTPVKIVPCGLIYFHAHRFRSKAVVQYGQPFDPPVDLVELYKTDSRKACSALLEIITKKLMEVTVNTPDYKTNKLLQTVRRMYQPDKLKQLTGRDYMAYSRKFTNGFEKLQNTPQAQALMKEVEEYTTDLTSCGWKDKELKLINRVELTYKNTLTVWGYILTHALIVLVAFPLSFPGIILNFPIMYLSRNKALAMQKIALAGSKVKVGAYDVVASEMVKSAGIFVPIFYIIYIVVAAVLAGIMIDESHPENYQMLEWLVPLSIFLLLPTFSYYSILLSDHWYFSRKKVRAVVMRNSKDCRRLLKIRKNLQTKVRRFVEVHLRENTFAGAYAKGGLKSGDRELSREDDRMQTLTEEEGTNSESGGEGSRKVYPERVKVEGVA
ncbi:hypothetical protein TL16_g05552 [Triparma laevis f. inornata]|uniref:Phospholipid/glycerol acyltransferase domain-containing protein n=1 Tax=Triparma laevis f. inornata TaxID=1714386 RepID=A0A9W7AKZ6_9STRA|nr:hypothetical protein TL16_g05552 [Triparma laevis f. inornata]